MYVTIQNPRTGKLKTLKVGWSWVLFFWSGLFGLPLFLRRLYGWGTLMLLVFVANFVVGFVRAFEQASVANTARRHVATHTVIDYTPITLLFGLVCWGLSIYLGIKGNELTGRNYIDHGWVFTEPDSGAAVYARKNWQLPNSDARGQEIEP